MHVFKGKFGIIDPLISNCRKTRLRKAENEGIGHFINMFFARQNCFLKRLHQKNPLNVDNSLLLLLFFRLLYLIISE